MPDGSLLGITSNQVGMPEAFKDWIAAGADRDAVMPAGPCLTALHVLPDGSVYLYSDGYIPAGPLEDETFTIGSGRKYALGAIHAGADAYEAVEIAIACDVWCAGPIMSLFLSETDQKDPK
jgi:ATP-dependent protease HslVU (ClpYQ) peptidase subunit